MPNVTRQETTDISTTSCITTDDLSDTLIRTTGGETWDSTEWASDPLERPGKARKNQSWFHRLRPFMSFRTITFAIAPSIPPLFSAARILVNNPVKGLSAPKFVLFPYAWESRWVTKLAPTSRVPSHHDVAQEVEDPAATPGWSERQGWDASRSLEMSLDNSVAIQTSLYSYENGMTEHGICGEKGEFLSVSNT